jgi:hypothetical protein
MAGFDGATRIPPIAACTRACALGEVVVMIGAGLRALSPATDTFWRDSDEDAIPN